MTTFYFTYGSEGHAYVGGWTEITVPDKDGKPDFNAAIGVFNAIHPPKGDGAAVECGGIYTEEQFKTKPMYKYGNFGHFCRERMILKIIDETE